MIMRRVGLCYVFTNSFNVRLNKIQLESHICFCILSDAMLYSLYGNIKEKSYIMIHHDHFQPSSLGACCSCFSSLPKPLRMSFTVDRSP